MSVTGETILSGTEGTIYDRKLDDDIDTESTISYDSTAYGIDSSAAELPPPPSTRPAQSEFTCRTAGSPGLTIDNNHFCMTPHS